MILTCPQCKKDFIIDLPDDEKKHKIICPNCKNEFLVKAKCSPNKSSDLELEVVNKLLNSTKPSEAGLGWSPI